MTQLSSSLSATPISAKTPDQQGRILVVEDERHIARFLQYILSREGYQVVVEHDAEAALETARTFCPNAWLLDMVLPGMSGIDLLRILRREGNGDGPVVIILSAHWFGQDGEMLREAGANAQCAKPIAPATLIKKLHNLGIFPATPAGKV